MKLEYELSKLALEDIESLWDHTVLNWSIKQASNYYNQIFETIKIICANPNTGKSIKEVKEHHRSKSVGSHIIIYKVENNIVLVDRILHQRIDIENHLNI